MLIFWDFTHEWYCLLHSVVMMSQCSFGFLVKLASENELRTHSIFYFNVLFYFLKEFLLSLDAFLSESLCFVRFLIPVKTLFFLIWYRFIQIIYFFLNSILVNSECQRIFILYLSCLICCHKITYSIPYNTFCSVWRHFSVLFLVLTIYVFLLFWRGSV